MKIAIFGAQGRLGQELIYSLQEDFEVIPLSRCNVDISKLSDLKALLQFVKPDCIINAAAVTDINKRVQEKTAVEQLFNANAIGAVNLAVFAKENKIPFLHFSCSSVLAKSKSKKTDAIPIPQDVIGQSKLEGEQGITKIYKSLDRKNYRIIRLGLVYGAFAHSLLNNLQRVVKNARAGQELEVVSDICYSLSPTEKIAEFVKDQLKTESFKDWNGEIQHLCLPEKKTVFELVEQFVKDSKKDIKLKKVLAYSVEEDAKDFSLESA